MPSMGRGISDPAASVPGAKVWKKRRLGKTDQPPNKEMQRTALRAAADAERWATALGAYPPGT